MMGNSAILLESDEISIVRVVDWQMKLQKMIKKLLRFAQSIGT